jgi:NarL family two-component system sensor histidine kinase LiaS
MTKIRALFRRLGWKLMLSYTVVTIGSLMVGLLVLATIIFSSILLPSYLLFAPETHDDLLELANQTIVPLVRYQLTKSPPDTEGIAWLVNRTEGTLASQDLFQVGSARLSLTGAAGLEMLVLDADGSLLGRTGLEALPAAGLPFDPDSIPGLDDPLQAALAGETDSDHLVQALEERNLVIVAVPVSGPPAQGTPVEGEILGIAVLIFESLPVQNSVSPYTLSVVGRSLLSAVLAAVFMGTLFGWLTARSLVRRFRRLSAAADAWSQGDFSEFVDDPSGDELGQFAQRLNHMAGQLQSLLDERQQVAILQERNRMARELHDSAKQQAFAASAQLGAARALLEQDPKGAEDRLMEAERLMDEVRRELTGLIGELRPMAMDGQELAPILRAYASDWASQCNIELDLQVQDIHLLAPEAEQALFRIAQEALANVSRHSQAQRTTVALIQESDTVTLTISDDGQGFDTTAPHTGIGLHSMRERAKVLGGICTIKSAPGEGTSVTVIYNTRRSL